MEASPKHWMSVYTKPRNEKKVAERLERSGVEVYCPLQVTMRQWSDRKKKVTIPVFPSYVFVRLAESERHQVLQDPGILNFVYWLAKPAIIREEEILAVKDFLSDSHHTSLEVVPLTEGDRVRIKRGALQDKTGVVLRVDDQHVMLVIESLGYALKANISRADIDHE